LSFASFGISTNLISPFVIPLFVIPAKAGTHGRGEPAWARIVGGAASMGPDFRRDDEEGVG
jgi:hypothetical protein